MADCCSRRCRGDSSSSQISVIHWCSYSQVGKRAGYVCVYMFLAGSSRGMFRTLLCSCVCEFGVSWEEEPLQRWRARACPAQTKFRRTKRVGGKAFWPIAALSSQNCSGEFIGAQTPSGAIGTPGGQLSFYFYSREEKTDDTHHHHEENEISGKYIRNKT